MSLPVLPIQTYFLLQIKHVNVLGEFFEPYKHEVGVEEFLEHIQRQEQQFCVLDGSHTQLSLHSSRCLIVSIVQMQPDFD